MVEWIKWLCEYSTSTSSFPFKGAKQVSHFSRLVELRVYRFAATRFLLLWLPFDNFWATITTCNKWRRLFITIISGQLWKSIWVELFRGIIFGNFLIFGIQNFSSLIFHHRILWFGFPFWWKCFFFDRFAFSGRSTRVRYLLWTRHWKLNCWGRRRPIMCRWIIFGGV